MLSRLKLWWRVKTGQTDTPFDGESPYWIVSLVFHLGLLICLSFCLIDEPIVNDLFVEVVQEEEIEIEEEEVIEIPEEFHFDEELKEDIGAVSENGEAMALAQAEFIAELSETPSPIDLPESLNAKFEIDFIEQETKGVVFNNLAVKGHVGVGVDGAEGAIDRLTQEILNHMEENATQVVWLFDQSASLLRQRQQILDRIDRVYEELKAIEATGKKDSFKKHELPLLTSVYAFGESVHKLTRESTSQIDEIKKAIGSVERDDSGLENVFSAIYTAAKDCANLRKINPRTKLPYRNVMLIVISDEAGDDIVGMDTTIAFCSKHEMPVYVVGVPAPFGRVQTPVKWVDPDPNYDQSPQWTTVNQGPETLAPERIRLHFADTNEDTVPIDSGFGPYALTRTCYETGGIYFTVHPNRAMGRRVRARDTEAYSSHLSYFFDPDVMRAYRPDYVSTKKYWTNLASNRARMAVVQTAQRSWVAQMKEPRTRFEKLDEAAFVRAVTAAQIESAILEPQLNELYEGLRAGEVDRDLETSRRWQANFDLAMGRVMAVKVRTESYNAMLAKAKTSLKFEDEKSNVWELEPSAEILTGGTMKRMADKANQYLQRVVDEHPETPWAILAKRELQTPMGWKWVEEYLPPPPPPTPRPAVPAASPTPPPPMPRPPRVLNEKPRMIPRAPVKRPPPKL